MKKVFSFALQYLKIIFKYFQVLVRQDSSQQILYTVFEWIWQSNLQNFIFSWRVLREKMKIKVLSV